GKLDLAVANTGASSASVLLGNGDGTFQAPQTFAAGVSPSAITAADVTGDGRPDLVVANFASNTLSVLIGKGDGTFQPQQTFSVANSPLSSSVGDFNSDGLADLVSGGNTAVRVLRNDSPIFVVDHVAPTVLSINRSTPATDRTSADSV